MGATSVSGRLPPEVIQRIVRRNFGRFRLCYEKGVRVNPTLAGRVQVRFVIGTDGSVMNATGSGDLPDKDVVACVASAFRGLSFPQPEGGSVTVSFPISFFPGDGSAPAAVRTSASWSPPAFGIVQPKVVHQASDDRWMTEGEEQLAALRRRLEEDTSKRSNHVALVRGLIARGRFAEAVSRARNLTEIDPDSSLALDLFAQASLAAGDRASALGALDGLAELAPRSSTVHRRVARGLEAAGDERRACAHWRSLASLDPRDDEGRGESLRCRARSLGERDEVAREIEGANTSDRALQSLLASVRVGGVPAHAAKKPWSVVSASVTCDAGACPDVATIDAAGQVTASILPNERGEPGARGPSGVVRTILVGALPVAKAKVTVSFEGTSRSADVEGRRTVFLTHESQ
jgi:Ca-activated chloride channel family protein